MVGNDTDPDKVYGDTLRINSVGGPSNGSVKLNPDGTVTFTPTAAGAASFTYRVKDATGTVSAASTTVKLTVLAAAVNKAPTAVADGPFKTVEDTALTITAAQLVGND
ncbi:cadherin-like domain-containing protein, partial [Mycolicibacterium sp. F2034L]|uniref:cadherin-like domain-containing protein n=1 Tax=Mycolicibacterium sp. F2034L TaxID=2926422 RepID=UPI0035A8457E